MNKILVDTDTFSEIIKDVDPNVRRHATAYVLIHGQFTISAVTVMEVIVGLYKKRRMARFSAILSELRSHEVLSFDRVTAELAGQIVVGLTQAGRPIGPADPMIAATALIHGLELVTGNTRHYLYIQQLGYPLTLLNWRT